MDKALIFKKRVGPNNHVGRNFSKTLINMQLGSDFKNPSKIAIYSGGRLKIDKAPFMI